MRKKVSSIERQRLQPLGGMWSVVNRRWEFLRVVDTIRRGKHKLFVIDVGIISLFGMGDDHAFQGHFIWKTWVWVPCPDHNEEQ